MDLKDLTKEQLVDRLTKAESHIKECHTVIGEFRKAAITKRLDCLFKIIDSKEFSSETKVKAVDEIESFIFPSPADTTEQKEEVNDEGGSK